MSGLHRGGVLSAFDTPWLPQVQLIAQGKLTATPEQALEMAIALIGREAERGLYIESNREWRDETHRLESELTEARARILQRGGESGCSGREGERCGSRTSSAQA